MREKEQQASAAPPCIHTLETGKHEWNTLHSVHQANARYWFRQCPSCGWIDTEDFAREVLKAHASLVQEMETLVGELDGMVGLLEEQIENVKFMRAMRKAGGGAEITDDETPMPFARAFEDHVQIMRQHVSAVLALLRRSPAPVTED